MNIIASINLATQHEYTPSL